jgi:hypothetical protein
MIGGSDPSIADLVPSDIVFRGNHFSRPMAWRNPIIPTPQAVFASPEAGGSLAPGTYGYRVVARRLVGGTTIGRSTASAEVTATVTSDTGGAIHVRWDPVPDASEYQVYGRSPGTRTVFWRVTTPEFFDSGASGTPGAVPTSAGPTWMVKNLFELKNARLHAAFVDARISSSGSGLAAFWRVTMTVAVHGADERPVAGATMRVTWNGPLPIAVSCVSGADGRCTFDSGPMLRVLREWATFTVLNLSAPLGTYQPGVNHDKDGTATGMSLTIFRP